LTEAGLLCWLQSTTLNLLPLLALYCFYGLFAKADVNLEQQTQQMLLLPTMSAIIGPEL
jgi:hypothetical protein